MNLVDGSVALIFRQLVLLSMLVCFDVDAKLLHDFLLLLYFKVVLF
jgi:hypothetical protein